MRQASDRLAKPDARAAQAPEKKALSELFAAKSQIDRQIAGLQQQLGVTDPGADTALADAAAALERAQNEVSQAMSQMANAPPGLLDSLTRQQREIAAALAEKAKEAGDSKLGPAQKAAASAADRLSEGGLAEAVASMHKAQEGIQAAQAGASPARPELPKGPDQGQPSMAQLGERQAGVREQAEALLAAQEAAPPAAMDAAAQDLTQAANEVSPVAAGDMGALPPPAQTAVASALGSINSAAAQASGRQQRPAQASAAAAARALARAQAALALAQAGLSPELAQAESGGDQAAPGQQPGQPPANAGKPGPGKQPGQGQQPAQQPTPGTPSPEGTGKIGNWNGPGGANGPLRGAAGSGQFVRLPGRDRAAIQQSRSENYPQEYGPLVEQYLKNLSDQTGQK